MGKNNWKGDRNGCIPWYQERNLIQIISCQSFLYQSSGFVSVSKVGGEGGLVGGRGGGNEYMYTPATMIRYYARYLICVYLICLYELSRMNQI